MKIRFALLVLAALAVVPPGSALADDTPPQPVGDTHKCQVFFPEDSTRLAGSVEVKVGYDVAADGAISNVKLLESSGSGSLDDLVVSCVRDQWRCTPALLGGVPVASPGQTAIVRFTLQSGTTAP